MGYRQKMNLVYPMALLVGSILFLRYNYWVTLAGVVLVIVMFVLERLERRKKDAEWTQYLETLSLSMDQSTKQAITNLPIPLCMCRMDGTITWYNKKFSAVAMKSGLIGQHIDTVFEEISIDNVSLKGDNPSTFMEIGPKKYKIVYYVVPNSKKDNGMIMLYFIDETRYENLMEEYKNTRTGIILIQVDSFDEVLDTVKDTDKPLMEAEVERKLKVWAENYDAAIRKVSKDRYFVLVDEQNLEGMEDNKFSILDEIRSSDFKSTLPVTLSIGACPRMKTLQKTHEGAVSAMELAQGRGGDQCVIKRGERFVMYGGKTKAVEKKTRVKARIIAYALKDLVYSADHVLIMGHTFADLDALGSAMGVYGICRMLDKKANIVLNHSNTSIDTLYERIRKKEGYENIFINSEQAKRIASEHVLLVIVDTNKPFLTEAPELIDLCDKIVLIDHHRRGVEFVDKAVLVYHETYASSASEMVTELIQYIDDRPKLNTLEAESLLAGMMLDTKSFSFKTGVRTFEAAAFLRKAGADTVEVKTLFQGDVDSYMKIAEIVKNAKIIDGKIAMTHCDEILENPKLIAAKVADDLLNIKGVISSFVITKGQENALQISARSMGKMNVQLIMERLGGGGHMDTAATQMKDATIEEAMDRLEEAVMEYLNEEENQ